MEGGGGRAGRAARLVSRALPSDEVGVCGEAEGAAGGVEVAHGLLERVLLHKVRHERRHARGKLRRDGDLDGDARALGGHRLESPHGLLDLHTDSAAGDGDEVGVHGAAARRHAQRAALEVVVAPQHELARLERPRQVVPLVHDVAVDPVVVEGLRGEALVPDAVVLHGGGRCEGSD